MSILQKPLREKSAGNIILDLCMTRTRIQQTNQTRKKHLHENQTQTNVPRDPAHVPILSKLTKIDL